MKGILTYNPIKIFWESTNENHGELISNLILSKNPFKNDAIRLLGNDYEDENSIIDNIDTLVDKISKLHNLIRLVIIDKTLYFEPYDKNINQHQLKELKDYCIEHHLKLKQDLGRIGTKEFELFENMNIPKKYLKPLIKTILMEIYHQRLNEWTSGTEDDYEIELESLVIPGISTENDIVLAYVNVDYEASAGCPAKLYGPPEKCHPGESPEVNITGHDINYIVILDENNKVRERIDDFATWSPEQKQILDKAVSSYLESHEDSFSDMIMNKHSDDIGEPDEPEYDPTDNDNYNQ